MSAFSHFNTRIKLVSLVLLMLINNMLVKKCRLSSAFAQKFPRVDRKCEGVPRIVLTEPEGSCRTLLCQVYQETIHP